MSDGRLLPDGLAGKAEELAWQIAERLADTELVDAAARRSAERAKYPFLWGGVSLYGGPASLAVVFEYAARVDNAASQHWRARSRQRLRAATGHTHRVPLTDPSLGYGTAGLAMAIGICAAEQPGFRPALHQVHTRLAEQVLRLPDWNEAGSDPTRYDVIQGAAGILGYLVSVPRPEAPVRGAARRLIDDLVRMCAPAEGEQVHRRWHIAPATLAHAEDAALYPYGYVNLGMAHGIPGPLAALSRAWRSGFRRPGLDQAVRHIADQLVDLSVFDRWGRNWPRVLPLDGSGEPTAVTESLGRTAWCYGAPGVCSALLDAAIALDDDRLREVAFDGLAAELRRLPEGAERLDTPTLCHGLAGVLAITHKFAGLDPGRFRRSVVDLTERLLESCHPELPVFVQQVHGGAPDIYLDSPGLLDGAAGVALALWSAAAAADHRWQRALLIR